MLSLRQNVFVVEQKCTYLDADELDKQSWHLWGRGDDGQLVAYARLNFPNTRYSEPSFGRVLTTKEIRGIGAGRKIVEACIWKSIQEYPSSNIRISAQIYLTKFYEEFGFMSVGNPYDDEGIEHIDMVLDTQQDGQQICESNSNLMPSDRIIVNTNNSKNIEYRINAPISADQFIDLLIRSTLSDRRPIHDRVCMEGMIKNSNLIISAWVSNKLVGIARSMTDFHYACYLSDLAVCQSHQKCGIGKQLQIITKSQLGPQCKLILIAAPSANTYYEHIGFTSNPRCWVIDQDASIKT